MAETIRVTHRYDDIIRLPHHVSAVHPPMPRSGRAAQFSPFAALTGFEAAVQEAARLTEARPELDESRKEQLVIFLMNSAFMLSAEVALVLRKMDTRSYLVLTMLKKAWQAPMENGLICGRH